MSTLAIPSSRPPRPAIGLPSQRSVVDDLDPTFREIFLSSLVTIWFLFGSGLPSGSEDFVNTAGLVAFSVVLAWAGYRQIARNVSSMWTPLVWYRLAMLSYFGIGSLVPIWTNDVTRSMMQGFYQFYSSEIVRLNLLITIFHVIFLCTSKVVFTLMRDRRFLKSAENQKQSFIHPSNFSMITFGGLCLAVGSAVNYLVVLPQVVGWINLSFFSTLYNFASLSWLGYFMVTLWALRGRHPLIVFAIIVIALGESAIGFFAMSKSVILLPIVMVGLAFIYYKRTMARVLIFGGFMISLFMALSPMITFARETNQLYYSASATAADVPGIYAAYLSGQARNDAYADVQSGWARLSYVNAGTFAISQFDRGLPGNSYRYWAIVWIPRLIYHSKPAITDVSREFSYAANGNYDSSSSPGLAAEAYWNGGWIGLIGIGIALSIVFTLWSIYSFLVIQRSAWHLFFVVLLGMRIGIRVDGAFVADIIGPIGVAFLAHVVLEQLNRFLPRALGKAYVRLARTD